jgi:hypothetical protein
VLEGERIAVAGHRDGAGFDADVAELLRGLEIDALLVRSAPEPALQSSVCEGAVMLTTAPSAVAPGVMARPLEPSRTLPFRLLWRDEAPSPSLNAFVQTASSCVDHDAPALRPRLAAAA